MKFLALRDADNPQKIVNVNIETVASVEMLDFARGSVLSLLGGVQLRVVNSPAEVLKAIVKESGGYIFEV